MAPVSLTTMLPTPSGTSRRPTGDRSLCGCGMDGKGEGGEEEEEERAERKEKASDRWVTNIGQVVVVHNAVLDS